MPHPLVLQLRFTRSEFSRALEGLSEADATKRLLPMNSISWNVGHLAWQEQRYWFLLLQGKIPWPILNEQYCYGCPGFAPPLAETRALWQEVTQAADPFLDTLTTPDLARVQSVKGIWEDFTAGNMMQRVIYHYWYHTGKTWRSGKCSAIPICPILLATSIRKRRIHRMGNTALRQVDCPIPPPGL